MSFPNKSDRLTCWNHRDLYWKCLDDKNAEELCVEFRKEYMKNCPPQWVCKILTKEMKN